MCHRGQGSWAQCGHPVPVSWPWDVGALLAGGGHRIFCGGSASVPGGRGQASPNSQPMLSPRWGWGWGAGPAWPGWRLCSAPSFRVSWRPGCRGPGCIWSSQFRSHGESLLTGWGAPSGQRWLRLGCLGCPWALGGSEAQGLPAGGYGCSPAHPSLVCPCPPGGGARGPSTPCLGVSLLGLRGLQRPWSPPLAALPAACQGLSRLGRHAPPPLHGFYPHPPLFWQRLQEPWPPARSSLCAFREQRQNKINWFPGRSSGRTQ